MPLPAHAEILNDLMSREQGSPGLLDAFRENHRRALAALAAAGYTVVRLDVADLTQIIRTADGDRLARSDELAEAIVAELGKES